MINHAKYTPITITFFSFSFYFRILEIEPKVVFGDVVPRNPITGRKFETFEVRGGSGVHC
jgi:hypothetical protein